MTPSPIWHDFYSRNRF